MKNHILKILIVFSILLLSSCSNSKIAQYKSYGIDYLENSNYEEALSYFDQALKLGDGEVSSTQYELLLYKAECLFMLNRYKEAREIYETLKLIDKNNKTFSELYENLSSIVNLVDFKIAIDDNELERADEILLHLKEIGLEHEKSVMFNQGVLYEKKGEWNNALNAFNYFLKQYPNDEDALHEIEFINAQRGYGNN